MDERAALSRAEHEQRVVHVHMHYKGWGEYQCGCEGVGSTKRQRESRDNMATAANVDVEHECGMHSVR